MIKRAAARMKRSLSLVPGGLDYLNEEEINTIKFGTKGYYLDDPLFSKINYHPIVGSVEDLS